MPPGACKDRLADALRRFGRVPIHPRRVDVEGDHPAFRSGAPDPLWASGGLVHDEIRRVILLRHRPPSWWGDRWLAPGGQLREGETTVDGLRREVCEEVGIELEEPQLTRIFNNTLVRGHEVRHAYFAQFVAPATTREPRLGFDVREAKWFAELPDDMAFREDYEEDFRRLRSAEH